jgi:hypothetical protein
VTISAAIDNAYDQILWFPEVKRIHGGISLDEAKRCQRQHWLDDIIAAVAWSKQGAALIIRQTDQGHCQSD